MIWRLLAGLLALVALGLAVPAVRHLREVPPPPPPMLRAQIALPPGVTSGAGTASLDAAISPDGRQIALVATRAGTAQLWLQTLETGDTRPLAGTDGASMPAWSHDGLRLAYFAEGRLRTLTLDSMQQAEVAEAPDPGGAAWAPDGSLFYAGESAGTVRRLTEGTPVEVSSLAPGDAGHAFPFLDEAGRLVFVATRENGARVVRLLVDGEPRDLTETSAHAELHGSVLVHLRDDVLLAQRLDEDETRLAGRSLALATGVGRSARGRGSFVTTPRMVLWAPGRPQATALAWFNASGERTSTATEPGDYWQVRLAPGGREAAVTWLDPLLRTLDVAVIPLNAPGNARRTSLAIGPDTDPVWAPNGRSLLYRSAQSGPGAIMARPSARSTAPEEVVLRKATDLTPSDWRGDTLLFHTAGDTGTQVIVALDRRRGTETLVTRTGFDSRGARWSPSGRWIAYVSDEGGQSEVYVQAWPAGTPRIRATFGGGQRPQWAAGDALYFLRGDAVMRSTISAGGEPSVSTPQAVVTTTGIRDFAVTADGTRLLVIVSVPTATAPDARIILDWLPTVPPLPLPVPRL